MDHVIDTAAPEGAAVADDTRRALLSTVTRLGALGGIAGLAGCGSEESPVANYPTPTSSGTAAPAPTPTATPTILGITDTDLFVLLLQLHYLQAEFYARAVFGIPLAAALVTGTGTLGTVTGPRQVTFADPVLADIAREIAAEKIDQIVQLRAVLGTDAPARPSINLGVDADGTFTRYGIDSKVAVAPAILDVYANQERFLLGAFIVEDAVMTAWRAAATMMTSAASIDVAAGLLATSAAHVGAIRAQLYVRGAATGSTLRQASISLSDLRDSYSPVDDDRGVATSGSITAAADVNPADGEGQIFGRLPSLTINVFYMTRQVATSGGFFPAGLNGKLRESVTT